LLVIAEEAILGGGHALTVRIDANHMRRIQQRNHLARRRPINQAQALFPKPIQRVDTRVLLPSPPYTWSDIVLALIRFFTPFAAIAVPNFAHIHPPSLTSWVADGLLADCLPL
jgi:hypothetical protein